MVRRVGSGLVGDGRRCRRRVPVNGCEWCGRDTLGETRSQEVVVFVISGRHE